MNTSSKAPLGRMYEVEGRWLFLHRSGSGGPAVVFLPGASAVGLDYLNIHEKVAEFTTSVLYDRGGTGWSDPAGLPRKAADAAAELRTLLHTAEIPGPYVLVAHSLGGVYARRFLQMFPDEVAGVVYLDAFYEDWDEHMPERFHLKATPVPGNLMLRLVGRLSRGLYRKMFATWPRDVRDALIARHTGTEWQRAGALERGNLPELRDELKAAGPVPEVPHIVLTALRTDVAMRLMMRKRTLLHLTDTKRAMYEAMAQSVKDGEHRVLKEAAHSTIATDRPDDVIQAIRDLWRRVC
jgi:pimeloyl-ACP methyl ester carboxylesterase